MAIGISWLSSLGNESWQAVITSMVLSAWQSQQQALETVMGMSMVTWSTLMTLRRYSRSLSACHVSAFGEGCSGVARSPRAASSAPTCCWTSGCAAISAKVHVMADVDVSYPADQQASYHEPVFLELAMPCAGA